MTKSFELDARNIFKLMNAAVNVFPNGQVLSVQ